MTQVPDLLRRFVPTPHHMVVPTAKKPIAVESNERAIMACVSKFLSSSLDQDAIQKIHLVRIVRDPDVASDSINLTCVHSGAVVVLLRGCTTSFFLDVAMGELLGFLASDVAIKELEQRLLPALLCGFIPHESPHLLHDDKQVTSTASARDNPSPLRN